MRLWKNKRPAELAAEALMMESVTDSLLVMAALGRVEPGQRAKDLTVMARVLRGDALAILREHKRDRAKARELVAPILKAATILRSDVPECVLRFDDPRRAVHTHGTVFGVVRPHAEFWLAALGMGSRTRNLAGAHDTADAAARAAMEAGADVVIEAGAKQSGWSVLEIAQNQAMLLTVIVRSVETPEAFAVRRPDRVWTFWHAHGETGSRAAVVHRDELFDAEDASSEGREFAYESKGQWFDHAHQLITGELLAAIAGARDLGTFKCTGCK